VTVHVRLVATLKSVEQCLHSFVLPHDVVLTTHGRFTSPESVLLSTSVMSQPTSASSWTEPVQLRASPNFHPPQQQRVHCATALPYAHSTVPNSTALIPWSSVPETITCNGSQEIPLVSSKPNVRRCSKASVMGIRHIQLAPFNTMISLHINFNSILSCVPRSSKWPICPRCATN